MAGSADADMARRRDAIDDQALERADAHVGRDIPDAEVEPRPRQEIEHGKRLGIIDRGEVETPVVLLGGWASMPESGRIALDDFADGVTYRLRQVIA